MQAWFSTIVSISPSSRPTNGGHDWLMYYKIDIYYMYYTIFASRYVGGRIEPGKQKESKVLAALQKLPFHAHACHHGNRTGGGDHGMDFSKLGHLFIEREEDEQGPACP